MTRLEYIDTIRYEIGRPRAMFLVGDLERMRNMPVAVFGTGTEAYFAHDYLKRKNIEVEYFINNDGRMAGKNFCGRKIVSPQEVMGKDYYVVIAMNQIKHDNEVLWQLKLHHHEGWGMAFSDFFHSFWKEGDTKLHEIVMQAINQIWTGGKKIEEIIKPVYNVGPAGHILGILPELCWSTTWSNCLLEWFYEMYFNDAKTHRDMLEIGPGQGLFSLAAKAINPGIDIRWLMFNVDEMSNEPVNDKYAYYPANQFQTYYGMIEHPEYIIRDQFDMIVMTEVMEHFVLNPVHTMEKIAGLLKPEGLFFLSTPDGPHLPLYESYTQLPEFTSIRDYEELYVGHTYQYTKGELEEVLQKSGLEILRYGLSDSGGHNVIARRRKDKWLA